MAFIPLRTIALTSLLLSFTRVTLPALARPVPSFTITASAPINRGVIFDITFALVLFFVCVGSFTWLASRWTAGVQPAEFFNRLCAIPIAFSRQLSVLCRSTFIGRTATTILNADNGNAQFVPRRGGASYPVATVPRGLQGSGPKGVRVNQTALTAPAAEAPSTRSFD